MGMKGVYKNSTDHEIESFWMISDIRNGHVYRIDEKSQACSSDSSIVTPTVCIPGFETFIYFLQKRFEYFIYTHRNSKTSWFTYNST